MSAIAPLSTDRVVNYNRIFLDATADLNTDVEVVVPASNNTLVFPLAIVLYKRRVGGTFGTDPQVTLRDSDGNTIAAALALTDVEGDFQIIRPAGSAKTITAGRTLQLRLSTAAVGQATTNRARTDNIATITTGSAHGLLVGDLVRVNSLADASFNGQFTVLSVPTTTTFTYANPGADVGTTADTAGRLGVFEVDVYAEIFHW